MITSTDIFQEVVNAIELVDKTGTDYEKSMIKLLSIAIKLLHNIRTNQTKTHNNSDTSFNTTNQTKWK